MIQNGSLLGLEKRRWMSGNKLSFRWQGKNNQETGWEWVGKKERAENNREDIRVDVLYPTIDRGNDTVVCFLADRMSQPFSEI